MTSAISIFPVGIIGAGTMGCGIAELAAEANHTVHLYDRHLDTLSKARVQIERYFQQMTLKGKISEEGAREAFERIHFDHRLESLEKCRLVLEAITEDISEKILNLKLVEPILSESCILATNTATLSIASLAGALVYPERFLGLHFFNPATVITVVEVIPGLSTLEGTVHVAKNLVESWGKIAVVSKDTPGFIVNRVVQPYFSESLRILEESIADAQTIDWVLKKYGDFRMGPFELLDFIGIDSNFAINKAIYEGFFADPRFRPSVLQHRLVESKQLGRKSGNGFYNYKLHAPTPDPEEKVSPTVAQEIALRVNCMVVNEAADALFWSVGTKEDIDIAVEKAVNFPRGPLRIGDDLGLEKVVAHIDMLYDRYREPRYRVSPLLRKMVEANERFYK